MSSRTLNPVRIPAARLGGGSSNRIWFAAGLSGTILISIGLLYLLGDQNFRETIANGWLMIAGSIICFFVTSILTDRTLQHPGQKSSFITLPLALLPILVLVAVIAFGRFYYSRPYLICFGTLTTIWALVRYQIQRRPKARVLAMVPFGDLDLVNSITQIDFIKLPNPKLPQEPIDGVVVDMHADLPQAWVTFLADLVMRQIRIYHIASLSESLGGRVSLDHMAALHVESLQPTPWFNPAKRAIDLIASLVVGMILLPLALIVALAIRIESKGPAIYRQRRTGVTNSEFTMLKFRSMRADAEVDGAQFTSENDPRITKLGRFMRKTRIDEIPQLWNILKGDMSLVGPRPERPGFVEEYRKEIPHYELRHCVRPGLTGWAQIETGYSSDTKGTVRKLERDLYYVKYRSLSLDCFVIYRTVRTIFFGSGAR